MVFHFIEYLTHVIYLHEVTVLPTMHQSNILYDLSTVEDVFQVT
jgi:hypothetical protein